MGPEDGVSSVLGYHSSSLAFGSHLPDLFVIRSQTTHAGPLEIWPIPEDENNKKFGLTLKYRYLKIYLAMSQVCWKVKLRIHRPLS